MTSLTQALADLARGVAVAAINAACWLPNHFIERYDARLSGDDDD